MPDALVEYQLDGDPRIRTGQYRRERLLLFGRLRLEDVKVLGERGHAAFGKAPIAVDQLLQCRLGTQCRLRRCSARQDLPGNHRCCGASKRLVKEPALRIFHWRSPVLLNGPASAWPLPL